ncbi:MAG: hypothetical protein H7067_19490 [Burkholderiales bacterium]|nr:hypothetical protein [Opitutaceae bacterium]
MKHPPQSLLRAPLRALVALFAVAAIPSVFAEDAILRFDSDQYLATGASAGDVELARPPKPARSARHTLHPFGLSSPDFGYTGPRFSLGHEVRASAPSNLTVGSDKAVVEDDVPNGTGVKNDTIAVAALGDWPAENLYSVATVVVFPTAVFDLGSLSYSALNWTDNKSYNDKLRHRWVVGTGGKFYVNAGFLGRTGVRNQKGTVDIISASRLHGGFDRWVPYDPAVSIFADFSAPEVRLGERLGEVTAVGFYMDALDYQGAGPGKRQWQLRLISFHADGVAASPAPAAR